MSPETTNRLFTVIKTITHRLGENVFSNDDPLAISIENLRQATTLQDLHAALLLFKGALQTDECNLNDIALAEAVDLNDINDYIDFQRAVWANSIRAGKIAFKAIIGRSNPDFDIVIAPQLDPDNPDLPPAPNTDHLKLPPLCFSTERHEAKGLKSVMLWTTIINAYKNNLEDFISASVQLTQCYDMCKALTSDADKPFSVKDVKKLQPLVPFNITSFTPSQLTWVIDLVSGEIGTALQHDILVKSSSKENLIREKIAYFKYYQRPIPKEAIFCQQLDVCFHALSPTLKKPNPTWFNEFKAAVENYETAIASKYTYDERQAVEKTLSQAFENAYKAKKSSMAKRIFFNIGLILISLGLAIPFMIAEACRKGGHIGFFYDTKTSKNIKQLQDDLENMNKPPSETSP